MFLLHALSWLTHTCTTPPPSEAQHQRSITVFLYVLQVLAAEKPKQPGDARLPYVDKDRARQREEKALQASA